MIIGINNFITYAIAFSALAIASYTDLKTREVPDWLNYGLIGAGLGLNLLFTAIYWKWNFFIGSIIGLSSFFILAWAMFYSGQWGGGDSKILMGLGALIGIDIFAKKFPFMANFFVNALFVGAAYGLLWSFFLAFKNKNKFSREFKKISKDKKVMEAKKWILILFFVLAVLAVFVNEYSARIILMYLALMSILTFYIWIFVKAVEKACMLMYVEPQKLTEGDWIVNEIKIDGKYITGPKDLGIGKKQINELVMLHKKGKIKKVLMKIGIPFVPSFFIAFVVTLIYGNLVFLIV